MQTRVDGDEKTGLHRPYLNTTTNQSDVGVNDSVEGGKARAPLVFRLFHVTKGQTGRGEKGVNLAVVAPSSRIP